MTDSSATISIPASSRDHSAVRRLLIWTSLLLIPGLAIAIGWPRYLEYKANWGIVVPGKLYRSAEIPKLLFHDKMREADIATIVYLSHDDENDSDMTNERLLASQHRIPILNFPMEGDGTTQHPELYVDALCAIIKANNAGDAVLVHCHSGAQRTGGVIAIYRTLIEGKTAQEAVAEMIHYRHDPAKNPKLLPFLNAHVAEWAAELVHRGIIAKVPSPLPHFAAP